MGCHRFAQIGRWPGSATMGAMAKYEVSLTGNFDAILQAIDQGIMQSVSAKLEDGSDYRSGAFRCAVRVYERYSAFGGNRVSLNITLIQDPEHIFLTAITAGGSRAVFFKVDTVGENTFLNRLIEAVTPFVDPRALPAR